MRSVHYHEMTDEQIVYIGVKGPITLDVLEDIEQFCHRQRFRIAKELKAKLDQTEQPVTQEVKHE